MSSENILSIQDLVIHYETDEEVVEAVNGITLELKKGGIIGLVRARRLRRLESWGYCRPKPAMWFRDRFSWTERIF